MQKRTSEMLPSVCRGGSAQPYTHLWGVPSGAPEITRNKCTSWAWQGDPKEDNLKDSRVVRSPPMFCYKVY